MKVLLTVLIIINSTLYTFSKPKTIHVFVSLCDNINQGIVPVPKTLGNGQDPQNNLYWGAMYGVKSFFKYKSDDWKYVSKINSKKDEILERVLFKHKTEDIYMLADAYDGKHIKTCTEDFLKSANQQLPITIEENDQKLTFGGNADLLAYIGHDGLMEFSVNIQYQSLNTPKKDVIILACYSKSYFSDEIKKAQANPVLWTTHLMAPEAYTLDAAIDGWVLSESGTLIKERAAQSYNTYQKCGLSGSRKLFTSGF